MTATKTLTTQEFRTLLPWFKWARRVSLNPEEVSTLFHRSLNWAISAHHEGLRVLPPWFCWLIVLSISPHPDDLKRRSKLLLLIASDHSSPMFGLDLLHRSQSSLSSHSHVKEIFTADLKSWLNKLSHRPTGRLTTLRLSQLQASSAIELIGLYLSIVLADIPLIQFTDQDQLDLSTLNLINRDEHIVEYFLSTQSALPSSHILEEAEQKELEQWHEFFLSDHPHQSSIYASSLTYDTIYHFQELKSPSRRLKYQRLHQSLLNLGSPRLLLTYKARLGSQQQQNTSDRVEVTGGIRSLSHRGSLQYICRSELIYQDEEITPQVDQFTWKWAHGDLLYFKQLNHNQRTHMWRCTWYFDQPDDLARPREGLTLMTMAHLTSLWLQRAWHTLIQRSHIHFSWVWGLPSRDQLGEEAKAEIDLLGLIAREELHHEQTSTHFGQLNPRDGLEVIWTRKSQTHSHHAIIVHCTDEIIEIRIPRRISLLINFPEQTICSPHTATATRRRDQLSKLEASHQKLNDHQLVLDQVVSALSEFISRWYELKL